MSDFEQKLKQIHRRNCERLPADAMATILNTRQILEKVGIVESSLQIGDTVKDFAIESQWCNASSLYELLATGPVILSFYRGFWCSYCREEMSEYQQMLPQLIQKGLERIPSVNIHYLAVCPQQIIEQNIDLRQQHYIIDRNLHIAKQFGIAYEQPLKEQNAFANMGFSVAKVNKMSKAEMALPAMFIINQKGTITYRLVSTDYRDRQDPNEIPDLV